MSTNISEREAQEYLKRLTVLFVEDEEVSRELCSELRSVDKLLKRAVKRIPPVWQFPDITEARIEIGGKSFQTARFEETPWILAHDIIVKDNKVGKVTVCCLEELTFSPEELTLLNAIGNLFR